MCINSKCAPKAKGKQSRAAGRRRERSYARVTKEWEGLREQGLGWALGKRSGECVTGSDKYCQPYVHKGLKF